VDIIGGGAVEIIAQIQGVWRRRFKLYWGLTGDQLLPAYQSGDGQIIIPGNEKIIIL